MALIPEKLLQNHEDGKVVLFCGAGVSVPAGLPSFKTLVELILTDLLPQNSRCQPASTASLAWQAFDKEKYDVALGVLESPQHGGYEVDVVRDKVRHHLSKSNPKTLDNHLTLVRLAKLDTEYGRLVTTNFDRLFERAQETLSQQINSNHQMDIHNAPALPPAKPGTFQGLVHLHGRLGGFSKNRQLVLTEADFGTAYMLEGWALRFIVDLFRHYHVVFIGYSVEDPTIRYLVQALAAARNEHPQQFKEPFTFAPYCSDEATDRDGIEQRWNLNGITPILYDKGNNHQKLWQALGEWADDYRQGITGRRQLVSRLSQFPPVLGENDPEIRQMAWALKDPNVAEYFANLNGPERPAPEWIVPLDEQGLLSLPIGQSDSGQPISIPLVSAQRLAENFELNEATFHLGRWIARCLDSQIALDWALIKGAILHSQFRRQIRKRLNNNSTNLPLAQRKIWQLLSDGSYAHMLSERYEYHFFDIFSPPSLAPNEKSALRNFLNKLRPIPILKVKSDYLQHTQNSAPDSPTDWCRIEIELVGFADEYKIEQFRDNAEDWDGALAAIADDLTTRLREALDWICELRLASPNEDITHLEYRSISPSEQNQFCPIWTQLIALTRESYDILVAHGEKDAAIHLVRRWRALPYPVFRRLVLYAVTENTELDIKYGLEILLDETQPALWDVNILRESCRLLRKRGQSFQTMQINHLIEVILEGPPREMYRQDLNENEWNELCDREIFLRLYKLKESGASLPVPAEKTYDRIQRNLQWQPSGDHSEEFIFFISSDTAAIDLIDSGKIENFGEMSPEQFINWFESQERAGMPPWECSGGWSQYVTNNIEAAVKFLKDAADREVWVANAWHLVLSVGNQAENLTSELNEEVAEILVDMPIKRLSKLALEAARWLERVRQKLSFDLRQKLWRKIWNASCVDEITPNYWDFNLTLNHAGGILGSVLYDELSEIVPNVTPGQNPGFPDQLKQEFERIAEWENLSSRLARVRLSPMLFILYRIDPNWTERTFFSRMNPEDEDKYDPSLWEGFFWHARCPTDLLAAFKPLLVKVLYCLDCIPRHKHNRAIALFTYLAVPPDRGFSAAEAKGVLWRLEPKKLVHVAAVLKNMLEGANENSLTLWKETVGPWFEAVWPKRPQDRSPYLSESLARMAIASGEAFPLVVEAIEDILIHENRCATLIYLNKEEQKNELVSKHPRASLILINQTFHDSRFRGVLGELLKVISKAEPNLMKSHIFKRLSEVARYKEDS